MVNFDHNILYIQFLELLYEISVEKNFFLRFQDFSNLPNSTEIVENV